MTKLEVLNKVKEFEKAMGTCVDVYETFNGEKVSLTIEDFLGFNDDWGEDYADYDTDVEDEMMEWLKTNCNEYISGFYHIYRFDGFYISLGWSSYDI